MLQTYRPRWLSINKLSETYIFWNVPVLWEALRIYSFETRIDIFKVYNVKRTAEVILHHSFLCESRNYANYFFLTSFINTIRIV